MELNLTTADAVQKTIRFDKTIFELIAEEAKREDRSFNAQINRMLRDALWIKLTGKPEPKELA